MNQDNLQAPLQVLHSPGDPSMGVPGNSGHISRELAALARDASAALDREAVAQKTHDLAVGVRVDAELRLRAAMKDARIDTLQCGRRLFQVDADGEPIAVVDIDAFADPPCFCEPSPGDADRAWAAEHLDSHAGVAAVDAP